MLIFLRKHKETLLITLVGFIIMATFNFMMVYDAPDTWTNPKVGYWTGFWNRFEFSGFDPYTYIIISLWRPLYVLARHPLLSAMVWPLAELNAELKADLGINCAIYIVAVLWTMISTCSWVLTYKICRKLQKLTWRASILLTFLFFGFSHIMLTIFVPDHFTLSLPLILLVIYLAGKAIKKHRPMPLWQSLPLTFLSTGITTTNIVKIGFADLFTQKKSLMAWVKHFAWYLIPLSMLFGLYVLQENTTQLEETQSNERHMEEKAKKNAAFAKSWAEEKEHRRKTHEAQIIDMPGVSCTDYEVDRFTAIYENIFGEGLILHPDYLLKDTNKKHRPGIVHYSNWWCYLAEGIIVLMFLFGLWCGRRNPLVWMTLSMFLFDMVLHVGLNFAAADVYIMTAHWAFIIPIAISCIYRSIRKQPRLYSLILTTLLLCITTFLWWHNASLIITKI